jgi:DNA-binding transcriptional LysR family regulator
MRLAMELVWLEDFLEIVATRNFTSAAAARNVSQPAFSRRIKSLERWIGAELIDRSTYPVRLTSAGSVFLPRCEEMLRDAHRLRTDCLNAASTSRPMQNFAALHTLAMYFFPNWIAGLDPAIAPRCSSMHAGDLRDCIEHLSMGQCDFALTYHHPDGPKVMDSGPFESLQLGRDRLILVSATDADGRPRFSIDGPREREIPYLAYSWTDGYLGKLISLILSRRQHPLNLSTVYQSSLAEGLKRMAITGSGVAWLPQICVQDSLKSGELVRLGGQQMSLEMEIRLFRRAGHRGGDGGMLWKHLADGTPPRWVPADQVGS